MEAPSYVEILSRVVSHVKATSFSTDRGRWSEAIAAIKQQHPELLARVTFVERAPYSPHSREVNTFLRILQRDLAASKPNALLNKITVSAAAKKRLRSRTKSVTTLITDDEWKRLAEIVEQRVAH